LNDTHGPSLVATTAELDALLERLADAPMIAVDTEFVREKTYYPQLCVIQVASEAAAGGVDCLAPLDLGPLFERLFRADCTWVVHSARQDLEVLWQRAQRLPPHLIDTQVAAALAGLPPQIGLEGLLERMLGVVLGESFARTDWSRRPLQPAALQYAIDDVRYLLPAWHELESKLRTQGRLDWLAEDSRRLATEAPIADPVSAWQRLKGNQTLPFASQCAALALVRWRELAAQRADRPRRWLLADDVLLAVAARLPRSVDALGDLVTPRFAARHGEELLAAVAARTDPDIEATVRANAMQQAPDKKQLKILQERVRARAAELGIEPEILATRRDLAGLVVGRSPPHLRHGWRAAALADLAATAAPGD
jgi:ribonuclease D